LNQPATMIVYITKY